MIDTDIPHFLRLSQDERRAAWKGRKLTVQGAGFRQIDKKEEALRKRLQHEYDEQQKAKRAARLAAFLEVAPMIDAFDRDANRAAFAHHVVEGIEEMYPLTFFPKRDVALGVNTSGCPLIRVDLGGGEIYNVTITRARK